MGLTHENITGTFIWVHAEQKEEEEAKILVSKEKESGKHWVAPK